MKFIAILSATGEVFQLQAKSTDEAYRLFGKVVLKMDTDAEGFDTGNVDIDLAELKSPKIGEVLSILKK